MASSSIIRQTGVMGTPHYMSPEQWQGSTVDGRADVYSLGIVLYELLVGSVPFDGDGMGEIFRKHEQEPVPFIPTELGVPDWLESVVRRALEKDPSGRFDSAGDMLMALQQELLVDTTTVVITEERSEVSPAPSRDRRVPGWVMGLGAVGLLAVVVGVAVLVGPSITRQLTGTAITPLATTVVTAAVSPDVPTALSSPSGNVVVDVPVGAVTAPMEILTRLSG